MFGYNYFMISAFPSSKSKIYDYNRVIKNLNHGYQYLEKEKTSFWSVSLKPLLKKEEYIVVYLQPTSPFRNHI